MRRAGRFSRRPSGQDRPSTGAPAPTVTSLSVTSAVRWSGAAAITVNGTNFVAGSIVQVNGATTINDGTVTTGFVSATQLTANLPREAVWEAGALAINVINPDMQQSGGAAYTVTQPTSLQAERRSDQVVLALASEVQTWTDQAGTGDLNRSWQQANAANQGTLTAADAVFKNRPSVMVPTGDFYDSGVWSSTLTQPCTVFHVLQTGPVAAHHFWWDERPVGSTNRLYAATVAGSGAPAIAANATQLTGVGNVAAIPLVFVGVYNTATSSIYVNSKTANTTGAVGVGGAGMAGDRMGTSTTNAQHLNGKYLHNIILEAAPNTTLRNEIMDYLGWRYGIAIAP